MAKIITILLSLLCYINSSMLVFAHNTKSDKIKPDIITVYAAASMTDVLKDIADHYTASTHVPIQFNFAASSLLARQIEAGARADIFISADSAWMDYVEQHQLIINNSRRDLVSNRLVLIAHQSNPIVLKIAPYFPIAQALGARGRLAIADPDFVPAGRYARAALQAESVWAAVEKRLVRADNVRAALLFVARQDASLGIVYATDAKLDKRVRVIDVFPSENFPPIVYPAARLARGSSPAAKGFFDFLSTPQAQSIFQRHGFIDIKK